MTIRGHVRIEWERIEAAHRSLAATCDGAGMEADAAWHRDIAEQMRGRLLTAPLRISRTRRDLRVVREPDAPS